MIPHLIAIAGPSGAGKSTLASYLADQLPGGALLLSLDAYYRDLAQLPLAERHHFNFDEPAALDLPLLLGNLAALAQGQAVDQPVYLFPEHLRAAQPRRVEPAPWILLEGLFALYWEEVRRLCHTLIFVEAPDALCLERRLARDTAERGRSRDSILEQYTRQVRPMCQQHLLPTRAFAHLVLDGTQPIETMVAPLLARLGLAAPGR
ncbi:MAG: AAA family ATPase [Candidatus Latescibacteria bacterium]|nr:AAA family ATPase [Candidatus Latescibacterota bacterium]